MYVYKSCDHYAVLYIYIYIFACVHVISSWYFSPRRLHYYHWLIFFVFFSFSLVPLSSVIVVYWIIIIIRPLAHARNCALAVGSPVICNSIPLHLLVYALDPSVVQYALFTKTRISRLCRYVALLCTPWAHILYTYGCNLNEWRVE